MSDLHSGGKFSPGTAPVNQFALQPIPRDSGVRTLIFNIAGHSDQRTNAHTRGTNAARNGPTTTPNERTPRANVNIITNAVTH